MSTQPLLFDDSLLFHYFIVFESYYAIWNTIMSFPHSRFYFTDVMVYIYLCTFICTYILLSLSSFWIASIYTLYKTFYANHTTLSYMWCVLVQWVSGQYTIITGNDTYTCGHLRPLCTVYPIGMWHKEVGGRQHTQINKKFSLKRNLSCFIGF